MSIGMYHQNHDGPDPRIIYTAGYQGHTLIDMMKCMQKLSAGLVDVRMSAYSPNPFWRKPFIEGQIPPAHYLHLPQWGNKNYKFKGTPIEIADFTGGILPWNEFAGDRATILLCACADYESCHRKVLSGLLGEMGFETSEMDWSIIDERPSLFPGMRR